MFIKGNIYSFKMTFVLCLATITSGCVAIPYPDEFQASACETSTQRKRLRVVDITSESNTDSVEGIILSPILVPVTALFSGSYVLANNTYHYFEEKAKCS